MRLFSIIKEICIMAIGLKKILFFGWERGVFALKIMHIAPNAPYNAGWSYQENLLPKYQAALGHDVMLVVTNLEHCK